MRKSTRRAKSTRASRRRTIHFGRYVRGLRQRHRMTLEQVAEMVGRSPASISEVERGLPKEVPISLAYAYSLAFRVRFDRLCSIAAEPDRRARMESLRERRQGSQRRTDRRQLSIEELGDEG